MWKASMHKARELEKMDGARSYHLLMQHVANTFAESEYTSATRWVASALSDMQGQRQLFSHSVLKLLSEERDKLSRALRGTADQLDMFVATVDPPRLLQKFIITIMSQATSQSEPSEATEVRSHEGSFWFTAVSRGVRFLTFVRDIIENEEVCLIYG